MIDSVSMATKAASGSSLVVDFRTGGAEEVPEGSASFLFLLQPHPGLTLVEQRAPLGTSARTNPRLVQGVSELQDKVLRQVSDAGEALRRTTAPQTDGLPTSSHADPHRSPDPGSGSETL